MSGAARRWASPSGRYPQSSVSTVARLRSVVDLSEADERMLSGADGRASQVAMRMVSTVAEVMGAQTLVDVTMAHVGSCFYTGQVGVDFAEFLLAEGGSVAVPTLTNVSLVDVTHPELRAESASPTEVAGAKRLMDIYTQLGCEPVWTCAPYQELRRPGLGDQIVGSESNAVGFYNSVIGARTNKYGDFLDICAAITGRAPLAGLHTDEGRRGSVLFRLVDVSPQLVADSSFFHLLGIIVGRASGSDVPVIDGLPASTTEDQLKAIAAAAASSGAVGLFHAAGVTPEAPTVDAAFHGEVPGRVVDVTPESLKTAYEELSRVRSEPLGAVCLGTPHFSVAEFEEVVGLLAGRAVHQDVNLLVSTGRQVLHEIGLRGWDDELRRLGVQVVVDTCTYYSPIAAGLRGQLMTNSAKWAYYAPGMLGLPVAFAATRDCVEAAVSGEILRTEVWSD